MTEMDAQGLEAARGRFPLGGGNDEKKARGMTEMGAWVWRRWERGYDGDGSAGRTEEASMRWERGVGTGRVP